MPAHDDGRDPSLDCVALPRVDEDLVRLHGLFAVLTLVVSGMFGSLVALKFVYPDFLSGHVATTWGLLRYNHTQGILFGWLGNAFPAFLYHLTPASRAGRSATASSPTRSSCFGTSASCCRAGP